MRSTSTQAADVVTKKINNFFNRHFWDHVLDLDEMLWWAHERVDVDGNVVRPFKLGAIPIGLAAITAMWLLNLVFDWAGTNGWWKLLSYPTFFASFVIGFGGYFAIWRQIAKPRNIRFGAFVFATFNALQWKNPVRGAAIGAKTVLSLTGVVGLYYLFTALVLWTWGFSNSPMAFWIGVAAIIILAFLGATPGVRTWVMTVYAAGVLIMALWSTFSDVYHGKAFDPETGNPLYMVDPTTGRIDSEERTPADCEGGNCYSAETGEKLFPMSREQALRRNPAALSDSAISAVGTGAASVSSTIKNVVGSNIFKAECVTLGGVIRQEPTSFTLRQGCVVHLDAVLLKHGVHEAFYDLELAGANAVKLSTYRPADFIESSRWIEKDGRWLVELVPSEAGFAQAGVTEVPLVTYSKKL